MTAVQPVLIELPAFRESAPSAALTQEKIRDLIHDLRQPLSSIEAIAYYLEMTLPAEQMEVRSYMRKLQQLVDQSSAILDRAVCEARKPPAREQAR